MRIGIVVDSACDLPNDFIRQHNIVLLPITVRIGEAILADHRDEEATLGFLHAHVAERGHEAETIPYSVEQIRDLFLGKLVVDYDHVFCLTITSTRSPIHEHAVQASFAILNDYKPIRQAAGHNSPFALRVIDTQNLFAAQGVAVVEAVRMRQAGASVQQIRERLEQLALHTHGYMVPRDLYYLRARARAKGDRSVGLLSAALGTALDIKPVLHGHRGQTAPVAKLKGFETATQKLFDVTVQRIQEGLMTPTVCVSYGGELSELHALPGYARLREACQAHGVELYESLMSLTGMVNVGKGAVVVGFAAGPHRFG
ncbi:DegV family protein [Pseudoxanthomonas taiwanensis]|jgi:EDD domain protein, DegV family|uniref:Fatty acid-binding protein DegV n=1 Tax=Pseudoxanthomonas taiwanensis TaxID=176598 RepID=A0A921P620_9GAMM|nr:DegV family protein [Pseudoxanthomonas taiwanensis]KAF1690679.1 fatty acid-binding protein DegV [Pseudoxanthomonas taiwanensis]MBO2468324.1 fatty acid-binding protein DegV [Xanthomonadaceae bacterium]